MSCERCCVRLGAHGQVVSSDRRLCSILADDLGYNDVSFHGSSQVPTPNIDALAASGSQLNNYYVQPVCSPTRTSLLSGRHVIHTGVYVPFLIGTYDGLNTTCNLSPSLNPSQKTCKLLPEVLNGLGYDSHMVGKWHLGFYEQAMMPTSRGFKSSYGYLVGTHGQCMGTLPYYVVALDITALSFVWHLRRRGLLYAHPRERLRYARRLRF